MNMNEEGMLPVIVDGVFTDGTLIPAMPRCKEKYCQGACERFYKKIEELEDGYYRCPSGYTVYKRQKEDRLVFYCGIRVKGYYDKKKNKSDFADLPIVSSKFFENILEHDDDTKKLKSEFKFEKEVHRDLLHDVRKLDGLVKNKSEEIVAQYGEKSDEELRELVQRVRNISAMEEIISCKYATYDLVSNIEILSMGNKSNVSVYKKFDKVRYILLNYKSKESRINFEGTTDFSYKVHLSYFEVLPFLLMENAVKYSKDGHNVKVIFEEKGDGLSVIIESYGPYCPKEEIPLLFEKNYRGNVAKRITNEGTGIGLYLVNQICKQHGIAISIETEYKKKHNGIPLGMFKVQLQF